MSDLPLELVEEILSRVPATSLKRLRYTFKHWNVIVKDQIFSMKHFDRAAKQFLVCMLHGNKFTSLTVNRHDNNIADPFIEVKDELGFTENIKQVLSHCDGLLLCTTKRDRLVVWNPCTSETKFIMPYNRYDKSSMFALGYVNNKSCRHYKVLKYRSTYNYTQDPVVEFEIYEFSSCTWRVLEVATNFKIKSRCVSLKGNIYWLTSGKYLLCFDFSTERLVSLRLPFNDTSRCNTTLSLVREEKLSVLHQRFGSKNIEVWVASSDKINENIVLSWEIFLTVDICKVYGYCEFLCCGSFFIDEERKLVVCFCDRGGIYGHIRKTMVFVIGECNVYKEIDFGESGDKSGNGVIFNYTPSLVQIQESRVIPRSGKRKERDLSIKAVR